MREALWWVDDARHELHHGGSVFPCDRCIEALALWQGQALLLSSDTDCLSLWDGDGLVRLTRVGVYPQDMAVSGDVAVVCGGADCRLHLLELPGLYARSAFPMPGMPERITLQDGAAHVLTLMSEPEVHTRLIRVDLTSGALCTRLTLPGIPGAVAADADGLWVGVSGLVLHLPMGAVQPDVTVEGFEMPTRIEVHPEGVVVADALSGRSIRIRRDDGNEKGALTLR